MFERKKYKSFAKTQLSGRWKIPILMTLLIFIVSAIFSVPDVIQMLRSNALEAAGEVNTAASSTSLVTSIVSMIASAILEVASICVYIKMSRSPEPVTFSDFIEGFNNWARAILGTLWQALWVFLWSLLLFIPGIIKSIAYSQMFYLIVEYKDLSVTKAMKISMKITNGHKWDLFVMHLSFLGWLILSVFTSILP